jgi:hypothetical protein
MTCQRDILSSLTEKNFPQKVTLGDDYQCPIKGGGESTYKLDSGEMITNTPIKGGGDSTYKLDSGTPMKMKDVLYVPSLTKNLLYYLSFR